MRGLRALGGPLLGTAPWRPVFASSHAAVARSRPARPSPRRRSRRARSHGHRRTARRTAGSAGRDARSPPHRRRGSRRASRTRPRPARQSRPTTAGRRGRPSRCDGVDHDRELSVPDPVTGSGVVGRATPQHLGRVAQHGQVSRPKAEIGCDLLPQHRHPRRPWVLDHQQGGASSLLDQPAAQLLVVLGDNRGGDLLQRLGRPSTCSMPARSIRRRWK